MLDRDRLALRNAVDLDELSQDVARITLSKKRLGSLDIEVLRRNELSGRAPPTPMRDRHGRTSLIVLSLVLRAFVDAATFLGLLVGNLHTVHLHIMQHICI